MMNSGDALQLAELLCSRICHDLSGPVGAAAAGAELVADSGGDPETLELVSTSAAAASARLTFLRSAFGFSSQPQRTQSLRGTVERYFGSMSQAGVSPLSLEWNIDAAELSADVSRLVLNMVMTARDALPRGGTVSVECHQLNDDRKICVRASGAGARLADEAFSVLVDDAIATGPRGAQAQLLKILSDRLGHRLMTDLDESMVSLTVG
jgi:histidine phosphotransferase ChpT